MDSSSNKRIKLANKHEEGMKKPLSRINEDTEAYRTMFNPPMYDEGLKHINTQIVKAIDWEKKGVVCKPGNALANYKPSATALAIAASEKEKVAIATAERERVAKRTAEEAFNEVFALKKSIKELDGNFNFLNLLIYFIF